MYDFFIRFPEMCIAEPNAKSFRHSGFVSIFRKYNKTLCEIESQSGARREAGYFFVECRKFSNILMVSVLKEVRVKGHAKPLCRALSLIPYNEDKND